MDYIAGLRLLTGGDAERARHRLKAAYGGYSAWADELDERQRLREAGVLSILAALAGEQEAALDYRERALAHATATDDILDANWTR